MSTPDPNADCARRFAEQFNLEEERAHRSRCSRDLRRRLFPRLSEEELDALDAADDERAPDPPGELAEFLRERFCR